ncbi:MAG: tetratricopeptide repeat protein [Chloroflexota bacterium]|nr:tetratricopeptide repeat protein [Chloroflexota bacterium]
MAVVSELIDVGLTLKQQGKLKGAIEHFRQLRATYPENARIMFELAVCWSDLDVPEQALPLYRDLLARPKGKSLPAKDLPRLYTRLGAALYALQEYDQALSILDDGLRLHPSYRPLRAYRIFALQAAEMRGSALNDALELMLESLAPSRWDTFEDQIRQIVKEMRDQHDEAAIAADPSETKAKSQGLESQAPQALAKLAEGVKSRQPVKLSASALDDEPTADEDPSPESKEKNKEENRIAVDLADLIEEDFELDVKVLKQRAKTRKNKRARGGRSQLGKKSVRINISDAKDESDPSSKDDAPPTPTGRVQIPIDKD